MTIDRNHQIHELAKRIAARYVDLPQVEAVAMSGSQTTNVADDRSDLDLYVYVRADIPIDLRAKIVSGATIREIDNQFWEPGDEWVDPDIQIHIDVMFRNVNWIEEQLDRVLNKHQASIGYSTCTWHNVLYSALIYDRSGWFAALQQQAEQPYPEELQRAIIAKNYPLLRRNLSAYLHQIALAVERQDLVSLNHRVTALLASYFDILFALNRLPHPGEKRLVQIAQERCHQQPTALSAQVNGLICAANGENLHLAIDRTNELVDELDLLLNR